MGGVKLIHWGEGYDDREDCYGCVVYEGSGLTVGRLRVFCDEVVVLTFYHRSPSVEKPGPE